MSVARVPAAAPTGHSIPVWRQWYMVAALTVLVGVAYIDRGAIMLVADPIKADLNLSDTQISLLVGVSLSVFQLLISIPVGVLVDRFSRKNLIMIGAVLWSCTTAACGLATNFVQLFIGRMGSGFSDGGLTPASFSLIRDTLPPERHGRAFALFGMGLFIGGALSLIVGGAVVAFVEAHGPVALPLIGPVKTWQLVFLVIGLASIPFALLMLPAVEPPRRAGPDGAPPRVEGYGAALRFMLKSWKLYLPLFTFVTLYFMLAAGFSAWGPTLAHRNFGIPLSRVGYMMGIIVMVAPAIGLMTGGAVIDHLTRKGVANSAALVALCTMALAAIPQIFTSLMPTETLFWIFYFLLLLVSAGVTPMIQVMLARITPSHLSGKTMAVYGLIQVVFGSMLGPLLIGVASDTLFSGPRALAYAVTLNAAVFVPLAILAALWLTRATRGPEGDMADVAARPALAH